jgi:hypothetical protein
MTRNSDLALLGLRYYMPSIGRFTTVDPLRDETNWFAYVWNGPGAAVDPTGLGVPVVIPIVVGVVVGAWLGCCIQRAEELGRKAESEATTRFPPPEWVGRSVRDAYRHCLWMCLLTRAMGSVCARLAGEAREVMHPGQPLDLVVMDRHNNAVGIGIAASPDQTCQEGCYGALPLPPGYDTGDLWILKPKRHGNLPYCPPSEGWRPPTEWLPPPHKVRPPSRLPGLPELQP